MQRSEQVVLMFTVKEVWTALFGVHGPPEGMSVRSVIPTSDADGELMRVAVTLETGYPYVPGD